MAIDMIEENELAALDTSRLGRKSFVNDNDGDYAYISLRSKRYFENERQKDAKAAEEIRLKYLVDAIPTNDCGALRRQLQVVQVDIENEVKKGSPARILNPMRDTEAKLKGLIAKADCSRVEEAISKAAEQAQIEQVLRTATETAPTVDAVTGSNTTKYLIYGAGGVLLLVAVAFLFKK